jgi:predicted RNase H-like nuclease (RuvC/YqgF family)
LINSAEDFRELKYRFEGLETLAYLRNIELDNSNQQYENYSNYSYFYRNKKLLEQHEIYQLEISELQTNLALRESEIETLREDIDAFTEEISKLEKNRELDFANEKYEI